MPFKRRYNDKYAGSSRERICCPRSVRLVLLLSKKILWLCLLSLWLKVIFFKVTWFLMPESDASPFSSRRNFLFPSFFEMNQFDTNKTHTLKEKKLYPIENFFVWTCQKYERKGEERKKFLRVIEFKGALFCLRQANE